MNWWIWGAAALAYGAFLAWYENWRGPLAGAEIDALMEKVRGTPSAEYNDMDVLRAFLEKDDGREFVMVNVVRVAPGEVPHPHSGEPTRAADLMRVYTRAFVPALLARGGHPVLVGRKTGGYFDAWRVPPDPGWTILGTMRYRSRRDMMELVVDPRFHAIHPFKMAGTAETFSFPSRPVLAVYASPRVWVALLLVVAASFVQIALLLRRLEMPS